MSCPPEIKVDKSALLPQPAAVGFCAQNIRYLRKTLRMTTYLEPADLAALKVKCTDIEIGDGIPKDEGLKVLELKSLDEINDIAEANRLIDMDNDKSSVNARTPAGKTLMDLSPWKVVRRITENYVEPSKIHWQARFSLHVRDDSMPDVVCYLANEAPLVDDKLFLSELWCVLRLGARQLKRPEYSDHKIAPVTVVSASGRTIRIVQGYADGADCIFLRKSGIVDVDGIEEQKNLEKMVKVACWLLGKPCRDQIKGA
ncbi:hypothetical protein GGR52DRAFT_575428 [Hypoxylon sp. FL1284]|nr:hypothetical protein GGR52DRAFT_575428 [Hypoxylon sp. FL1284]